jgi:hypothetical protein
MDDTIFKPKFGGETGPEPMATPDHPGQAHLDTQPDFLGTPAFDGKPNHPLPAQAFTQEGADNTALGRIEIPV